MLVAERLASPSLISTPGNSMPSRGPLPSPSTPTSSAASGASPAGKGATPGAGAPLRHNASIEGDVPLGSFEEFHTVTEPLVFTFAATMATTFARIDSPLTDPQNVLLIERRRRPIAARLAADAARAAIRSARAAGYLLLIARSG